MNSGLKAICGLLSNTSGLAAFLDELPLGVAVLDPRGRVVTLNRAYESLTGADRRDMAGIACMHALRCSYCVSGCPVQAGRTRFRPRTRDADLINRDRIQFPVRLTLAPLFGADGAPVGFVETVERLEDAGGAAESAGHAYGFGGIVGKSPAMERIFRMVPSVAQTDSSVLITGETGTGKDLLAEAVHKASDRARGPFVKVNCGALPDTLLESELFGHVKGAFTGAERNKQGRVRLAHGGTLFLTEIGDLPLKLQVKLLSFLDDKIIHPLGSDAGFAADVRVIVATHRDLEGMVRLGTFRQDLMFRLNVIRLRLPPLRERGRDAALIRGHFLREFCERFQKDIRSFSDAAGKLLAAYPYPGNVRELRNIVEYAANFCTGKTIHVHHLPAYLVEAPSVEAPGALLAAGDGTDEDGVAASAAAMAALADKGWEAAEKRMIMEALVRTGGRRGRAAELLGWGRSTMWRKCKRHNIGT